MSRFRLPLLALACLVLADADEALALDYPTRPVRLVVGFPAGGPTDVLARLVNKSLVQLQDSAHSSSTERYLLLETIRDYAIDRLEEAGEVSSTCDRHLAWVSELAERLEPAANNRDAGAVRQLGDERANLSAALEWAVANDRVDDVLRVVGSLGYAFVIGLAYSAFSAVVLEVMGHGAGATKYNIFASLSNFPIWWLGLVLGVSAEKWGPRGMLLTEAGLGVLGVALFYVAVARVRRSSLTTA